MSPVVALTALSDLDSRSIDCAAAPMVAGELRRRAIPAVTGKMPTRSGTVFAVTFSTGGGEVAGLGVAVPAGQAASRTGDVLADWFSATGPRTVLLAGPRSFCAGVERAIEIVRRVLRERGRPEEIEGTLGEAPESIALVEDAVQVNRMRVDDPDRTSYLTQTTLAVDEIAEVVDALRTRFPALRGPSTEDICYASTNRQASLLAVAEEADLVLVVGSANSSNSLRLVELARRHGTAAHLIDDASEIRPAWLTGVRTVGLTAGASAPHRLVDDVLTALRGLGPVEVVERTTTRETLQFGLPRTAT